MGVCLSCGGGDEPVLRRISGPPRAVCLVQSELQGSGLAVRPAVKPNDLGLFDMLGNVFEWCLDEYGDYPSAQVTSVNDIINILVIYKHEPSSPAGRGVRPSTGGRPLGVP